MEILAPLQGRVAHVAVSPGESVPPGSVLVVLEVMKMEHPVVASLGGQVTAVLVSPGDGVVEGQALVELTVAGEGGGASPDEVPLDLESPARPDLAEVLSRRVLLGDDSPARAAAVAARHATGHRTVRENLADLLDAGSFEEWGGFAIAAQESRREIGELLERTPADGLVAGIGRIAGRSVAVAGYDYLVLAGTQGARNHRKKDRLFEIVERLRLPLVLFAEGGGGRPGDTDYPVIAGLDTMAFALFARLSALVPTVGIVNGFCFAGNAALLGCCDVIVATRDASIGMGGPAMIEGGGLGSFRPEEIGPAPDQGRVGVVDLLVADDAEAVAVTKRYLSYFAGPEESYEVTDQRLLRHLVPERRSELYEIRRVLETLCDVGSLLELRPVFGRAVVAALGRIEGRPVGLLASNPAHLGGAIDADSADKAARHVQLCDAYDLPIVSLCDTPGFMVGPAAEQTAQVRHFARMFVTSASATVPYVTVVLRKAYGLGAQAMAGGSFHASLLTVSWPTGEFGGMGLEGAVRLAFRRELEASAGEEERQRLYERLVASLYERGKALSMATHFEIDDVIDPAETRQRVVNVLAAAPETARRTQKKRPMIEPW